MTNDSLDPRGVEAADLLPCPHCGCTDISRQDNGDEEWFECDWCHATSGYDPAPEFEEMPLSFHWNRRTPHLGADALAALEARLAEMEREIEEWKKSVEYAENDFLKAVTRAEAAEAKGDAPLPAPQGEAWRPIETAPKDGTRILIREGENVTISSWDAEWQSFGNTDGEGEFTRDFPDSWMPLPQPGEQKEAE